MQDTTEEGGGSADRARLLVLLGREGVEDLLQRGLRSQHPRLSMQESRRRAGLRAERTWHTPYSSRPSDTFASSSVRNTSASGVSRDRR